MRNMLPVVYILSCGHSGSTILDLLLNAHSQMVGTGEIEKVGVKTKVRVMRCSCGRDFLECPFWIEYIRSRHGNSFYTKDTWQFAQSKLDFVFNRPNFRPLKMIGTEPPFPMQDFSMGEYLRDTEDLYDYILQKSGERLVVDSSKNTTRAYAFELYSKRIEPAYIYLVRDGRGVTWSYAKKYGKYWKYMMRWLLENLKVEILRLKTKRPFLRVSYRALTQNPEKELKRICAFLNVPYEDRMLRFAEFEHHQVGGNAATMKSSAIRADTAWRSAMPYRYQLLFNVFFGLPNFLFMRLAERSI